MKRTAVDVLFVVLFLLVLAAAFWTIAAFCAASSYAAPPPSAELQNVTSAAVPALNPPDPGLDPLGFGRQLIEAAKTKAWRPLIALVLAGMVFLGRRYGAKWIPWFKTDRGGAALVLGVGVLGSLATVLFSGAALGLGVLVDGVVMGVTAAGGYIVLKRLVWPQDSGAVVTGEEAAALMLPSKPLAAVGSGTLEPVGLRLVSEQQLRRALEKKRAAEAK